mmetsp:Transcript_29394/g.74958  ORF Transcript_29394/g.74958 Transcript_29394/m.74958 type:complete len:327 (-) Transcript_29394:114-1094(-)
MKPSMDRCCSASKLSSLQWSPPLIGRPRGQGEEPSRDDNPDVLAALLLLLSLPVGSSFLAGLSGGASRSCMTAATTCSRLCWGAPGRCSSSYEGMYTTRDSSQSCSIPQLPLVLVVVVVPRAALRLRRAALFSSSQRSSRAGTQWFSPPWLITTQSRRAGRLARDVPSCCTCSALSCTSLQMTAVIRNSGAARSAAAAGALLCADGDDAGELVARAARTLGNWELGLAQLFWRPRAIWAILKSLDKSKLRKFCSTSRDIAATLRASGLCSPLPRGVPLADNMHGEGPLKNWVTAREATCLAETILATPLAASSFPDSAELSMMMMW